MLSLGVAWRMVLSPWILLLFKMAIMELCCSQESQRRRFGAYGFLAGATVLFLRDVLLLAVSGKFRDICHPLPADACLQLMRVSEPWNCGCCG